MKEIQIQIQIQKATNFRYKKGLNTADFCKEIKQEKCLQQHKIKKKIIFKEKQEATKAKTKWRPEGCQEIWIKWCWKQNFFSIKKNVHCSIEFA